MYTAADIFNDSGVSFVAEAVDDESSWTDYFPKDKWVDKLQSMLIEEDLNERYNIDPSDMVSETTLLWPVAIFDEQNVKNKIAKAMDLARAQMEYDAAYGSDGEVIDLLCHETIVDIRMGMWRADRYLALRTRVYAYFELYNTGWFYEAVSLAAKLIADHEECGEHCDPQIKKIWQNSLRFIQENCGNQQRCHGAEPDVE
jgi:hypothetical protein